jgi:ADP-ribosyl-[dinitrogen reductase] hydrolase
MKNNLLSGVMGLCVGDCLGVPVEFVDRETLKNNPVVDMRSYGTYNMPKGTWSDDSTMTLSLVDSLSNGLDYNDIMGKFSNWIKTGDYTQYGKAFDVGNGTIKAITRFTSGKTALDCGGYSDHDNGNGSLMRILPILFYLRSIYEGDITDNNEAMNIIHNVSSLTHAHKRSLIACGIYISIANMLMNDMDLSTAVEMGIHNAVAYYKKHDEFTEELRYYKRLSNKTFSKTSRKNIESSGYVVDTLEATIWCLLRTKNYKDCVLMAVNLGEDTDTVAAVAGGLAGLYYGYDSIPKEWLVAIPKHDYIESLCSKYAVVLGATELRVGKS